MNGYLVAGAFAAALIAGVIGYAKGHADADRSAEIETLKEDKARLETAYAALERQADAARALAAALTQIDRDRLKELKDAQDQVDRLAADVAAGRVRLVVQGLCGGAGAAGAGTAGLDGGGTCELDPASRQDYFALRAGIERQRTDLLKCLATARELAATKR